MNGTSGRHDAIGPQGAALRDAKVALRARVLAERDALPADIRASASAAIVARLLARPDFLAAQCILVTASFHNEWDTSLVRAPWTQADRRIPRVDKDARMLELHKITDLARDVRLGYRSIPEPSADCPRIARDEVDFVVVPGVAFDGAGRRLGYGGGYYDRLLPLLSPRAPRVAGAFDVQVVDRVPVGPNDIAIDAVVTESRALSTSR
jgi:5-formyltetrahydrofolate cyclo-ligase